MNGGFFFYNDILSVSSPFHRIFTSNIHTHTHTSGSEDIGMGHTKSFGVLSWNARQETGSTAFIRCQRSRQRGPKKVSKLPRSMNESNQ